MRSWIKGLIVRVTAAIVIGFVAAKLMFTIMPPWAFPVVEALNRPIVWMWSYFYPTSDTYPPFYPVVTWQSFLALLIFAVPVYTALLYLPSVAMWLTRTTRVALQLPWAFLVYFGAGGLLGAMVGATQWTTSSYVRSWTALYLFTGFCALAFGWAMAVVRSYIGLWRRQQRSARAV